MPAKPDTERFELKCTLTFKEAVAEAAAEAGISSAEFVRRATERALLAHGYTPVSLTEQGKAKKPGNGRKAKKGTE